MNSALLRRISAALSVLATLAATGAAARAEVKPNSLFSDGAVLQQGVAVPVWGTGKDGEQVTVKIQDQTTTTTVKDGRWLVRLKPMEAGGPFTLTITGDNTVAVNDVLVGEVWLCSGQSNMAFHLAQAANAAEAIAAAADPQLRLFTVSYGATDTPKTDPASTWKPSSPETAGGFSAVAWFFGRDLRRALKVPVGLISSSVGGTPAEAWTDRATLEGDPDLKGILEQYAEQVKQYDPVAAAVQHQRALEKHKEAVEKAKAAGRKPPQAPRPPTDPRQAAVRPCCLYNAMIAPLCNPTPSPVPSGIRVNPTPAAPANIRSCFRP
jgi:sialate O-acetylesterase